MNRCEPMESDAPSARRWRQNLTETEVFTRNKPEDSQMPFEISSSYDGSSELSPSVILLVDDDPDVRLLTRTFLEHEGYSVFSSGDAERAVQIFRNVPQIDLVVTDLYMPGRSGMELARELKAIRREVPVLIISGGLHDGGQEAGLQRRGGVFWPNHFGCRSCWRRCIGFWRRWRRGGGGRRSRG